MSLDPIHMETQECAVRVKEETDGPHIHDLHMKEETDKEKDGFPEHNIHIKEELKEEVEPECAADIDCSLICDVKEENSPLELYAGHKMEPDLVLGPTGPQPPDSAFVQTTGSSSSQDSSEARSSPDVSLDSTRPKNTASSNGQTPCNGPHVCEVCKRQFKRIYNLEKHREIHITSCAVSCEVCSQRFPSKSQLSSHKKTHIGEKPYTCNVCGRQFRLKPWLETHLLTHAQGKRFCCEFCKKKFKFKYHLDAHKEAHAREKPYSCEACVRRFATERELAEHKKLHENQRISVPKPFSCIVCSEEFSDYSDLVKHKQTHSKDESYPCDMCDEQFPDINLLVTHKRRHAKGKRYSCNVCSMQFTCATALFAHSRSRVHAREPYLCTACGKEFARKVHLDVHILAHCESIKSKPVKDKESSLKSDSKEETVNVPPERKVEIKVLKSYSNKNKSKSVK